MSKFYGSVLGHHSPVTRTGHHSIKTTAQSYDGSVITELSYNMDNQLMVSISVDKGSVTHGRQIFFGTFDEYIDKLTK
jgi:hypothetical protein